MIAISQITDTLQQVASAIVSVMDVDVLIVDNQFNRLVGTGTLSKNLKTPVDQGSVFAYALKRGESFIIENPRTHEACKACGRIDDCTEQAELCCPITINGEVAGVIGLIAFDEQARFKLLARKDSYLRFVQQMADLIASKALEVHQHRETEKLAMELQTLVEEIGQGVLITDASGRVIRSNRLGCSILGIKTDEHLRNKLPAICLSTDGLRSGRHTFLLPKIKGRILCTIKSIHTGGGLTGYLVMVEKLKDVLKTVNQMIGSSVHTEFSEIIGESQSFRNSLLLGEKAAQGDSTVLILGESGTGKELFARAIHTAGNRRNEAFIPINCAAIPDHLLESELFGYEEGAFTGARKGGYIGKFEMADRGTLFLDEIGDMSLHLQTKLLRVLEERVVDKIGSRERIPINVRIIAATHQDIESRIVQGTFREDLYYRLNVIPLILPPLRERKSDILILADHFITEICSNRDLPKAQLDDSVRKLLQMWPWPGNVRELQNTMAYALQMASGNVILRDDLPERFRAGTESAVMTVEADMTSDKRETAFVTDAAPDVRTLDHLERSEIAHAIGIYGKDVEGAAKALGISRATLYRKISLYRIDRINS